MPVAMPIKVTAIPPGAPKAHEVTMAHASMTYILRQTGQKLLTPEEELELGRVIQAGQEAKRRIEQGTSMSAKRDRRLFEAAKDARNELVLRNVRLVQNVAKRYRVNGADPEDVFMYGVLGLFRAAELFDPDKGLRFSTYATLWIRQAINGAMGDIAHQLHVPYPQQLKEIHLRARMVEGGVSLLDAASDLGIPRATAEQLLSACAPASSLDQPVMGEAGRPSLGDQLSSPASGSLDHVDAAVDRERTGEVLRTALDYLDDDERRVMDHFLAEHEDLPTLDHVASATGMPATLVRSKRLSARSKLAHPAANVRQHLRVSA
jgi:RNA polymerase primary sigma factor